MTFDLYVWQSPRDLDPDAAKALVDSWQASGGDSARSPFEPSTDVGWFYRELMQDAPGLDASSYAVLSGRVTPIWISATDEPPARVVGIRLSPALTADALESIVGLAAKYDLVLFDTRSRRVHLPLDVMAAHASATFWPAGAIQAAVGGGIGAVIAVVGWVLGIPLLSGLPMLIGGFMFAMAVYTFIHEGRKALKARQTRR